MDTVLQFHTKAKQVTASEGLASCPYVAARMGFDHSNLLPFKQKATNVPPFPTPHNMCVYVYGCVCMCVRVCVCVYVRMYTCFYVVCMDVCMYAFMYVCMYACTYVSMQLCMYVCKLYASLFV